MLDCGLLNHLQALLVFDLRPGCNRLFFFTPVLFGVTDVTLQYCPQLSELSGEQQRC